MDSELIRYKNWKTGEKQEYSLSNPGWDNEQQTNPKCPFDLTP